MATQTIDRAGPQATNIKTDKTSSAVRLQKAIMWSEKALEPFRKRRVKFLKEYAGPYWGKGFHHRRPLNLPHSLATILVPTLMLDPHYEITHRNLERKRFANSFRLAGDDETREMKLKQTFRGVILNALFGPAIMKTALGVSGTPTQDEAGNIIEDPGRGFSKSVDFDDYIPDMTAIKREAYGYEGDKYTVPYEWAMDSRLYKHDLLERIRTNQVVGGANRADSIAWPRNKKGYEESESYVEHCDLKDLWLPGEGMIVTLPADNTLLMPYLAERGYEGPEEGPYDVLDFSMMPGNAIGIPIMAVVHDLYLLINLILDKQGDRAKREKDLGVAGKTNPEDADTIRDAVHGDVVLLADAKAASVLTFGGMSPQAFQGVTYYLDLFNRAGGNPEILGGLGADAPTLGQEEMTLNSATRRIADWKDQVFELADSVLRKIAWYMWTDPVTSRELAFPLAGGQSIPMRWDPDSREGEFMEYTVGVSATHQPRRSPEENYDSFLRWLNEVVLPLAPFGAQQGMLVDVETIAAESGRMRGLNGLERVFRPGPVMSAPGMGQGPRRTQNTTINMGGGRPRPSVGGVGTPETQTRRAE